MLWGYRPHHLTTNNPNSQSYSDTCNYNRKTVYRLRRSMSVFLSIFLQEILTDPFHRPDPRHHKYITRNVYHPSIGSTSLRTYPCFELCSSDQRISFPCTGNIILTHRTRFDSIRFDSWGIFGLASFSLLGNFWAIVGNLAFRTTNVSRALPKHKATTSSKLLQTLEVCIKVLRRAQSFFIC
jgi:hypothetical protein